MYGAPDPLNNCGWGASCCKDMMRVIQKAVGRAVGVSLVGTVGITVGIPGSPLQHNFLPLSTPTK